MEFGFAFIINRYIIKIKNNIGRPIDTELIKNKAEHAVQSYAAGKG